MAGVKDPDEYDLKLTKLVEESARKHVLGSNKNPDRIGCPGSEKILKMVGSATLPNDRMREHLVTCAPCLREFKKIRQSRKPTARRNASTRTRKRPVKLR